MTGYFDHLPQVRYAGPDSTDPLALSWYDANRPVLGRRMADWRRTALLP